MRVSVDVMLGKVNIAVLLVTDGESQLSQLSGHLINATFLRTALLLQVLDLNSL